MKCYNCNNPDRPIVYFEYYPQIKNRMALCFACLEDLGFAGEVKAILPKVLNCSSCGNKFLPKHKQQTKCGACWKKFFDKRRILA